MATDLSFGSLLVLFGLFILLRFMKYSKVLKLLNAKKKCKKIQRLKIDFSLQNISLTIS